MNKELKKCQNCHNEFWIETEDFQFYKKMKVPPPTWCPDCRFLRRIIWRNHKNLYRRKDDRTGKAIFSTIPSSAPVKVWDRDDWFSDIWDGTAYGKEIDWKKPFLQQILELISEVPFTSRAASFLTNSDFSANANNLKNCYLVFGSAYTEDSCYSDQLSNVKQSFNSSYLTSCEITHEGFFNRKCFKTFFSSFCEDSQELWFCRNCTGSSNCFGSVGLRNKSYYFFNQPLTKEEYNKRLEELSLGSFKNLDGVKKSIVTTWLKYPYKFMQGRHNSNVSGEYIYNSKNVTRSYHVLDGENLKYCHELYVSPGAKDCYDYFRFGENAQLIYESSICGLDVASLLFCCDCWIECNYLQYCISCHSASNCFGSVGLRNKQYCILNKQYTKEEYEVLVPKIIEHMNNMPYTDKQDRVYKYGEFFPSEFSPFAYNETIAQDYFPLEKEQAIVKGYRWGDAEERNYQIDILSKDLPDHIKDINDSFIGKAIECAHKGECNEKCTKAFKIIKEELQFYKKMNLPIPRLCPDCRYYQRLQQRNPIKLWHRNCQCPGLKSENGVYQNTIEHFHKDSQCPNEFETSYSPNRPEIVYCEQCYNSEIV